MSAPVGDVEDIVRINADGTVMAGSDFERMDSALQCIVGMRKHLHHNGVVLDGMQRLSHLCSQGCLSSAQRRENMALLGPVGLGVVILPAMQHYHFDNRLQVHACLALGSVLRQVQWDDVEGCAGEEVAASLSRFWVHVAGTVSKIMPAHAGDPAVQAYGTYLMAGVALRQPAHETVAVLEEKGGILAVCMALEAFPGDAWLVSNACLLFLHMHAHAKEAWQRLSSGFLTTALLDSLTTAGDDCATLVGRLRAFLQPTVQ